MLPELLFSAGSSIQEMSREEYSFLNGGTIVDRDTASASNDSTLSQLKLVRTPDLEPSVTIKLEESPDAYPWLNTDIESNLLRHSDDPLLSKATDDHQQNELATIKTTISSASFPTTDHQSMATPPSPCERRKSTRSRRKGQFKLRFHHQALPQEYLEHFEASKGATAAAAGQQRKDDGCKLTVSSVMDTPESPQERTNESIRNWLQKISELQSEAVPPTPDTEMEMERKPATTTKAIKYSDLPYMGEITLENSKPRRGRKPKKADICHLIYKNYGTIFPGTPKDAIDGEEVKKSSDFQSKIVVNSLLEKRLTQREAIMKTALEEPLNLCVRDMDSVILSDEESDSVAESCRTTPLIADLTGDALLEPNLKMTLPNFKAALLDKALMPETPSTGDSAAAAYAYWPNAASTFIHPMLPYYQKMIEGEKKNCDRATKSEPTKAQKGHEKKQTSSPRPSAASSSSGSSSKAPTATSHKRKRSAIFIPPIPAENASNPTTEVSICKFKFTGGAKPSLQEKKMLSVDSGGNFRYYSGTGDKSMRGYEFFPRESLQQSGLVTGSSAGAFLNTSPSEKITIDAIPPTDSRSHQNVAGKVAGKSPTPSQQQRADHRKRKSRRSLQREKLEKTFKERGFLIQTQQTESAEGATYCKFRQLKKFTRYLFRSWKDYLPGDLQQQQQQQQGGENSFVVPPSEAGVIRSLPMSYSEVGK